MNHTISNEDKAIAEALMEFIGSMRAQHIKDNLRDIEQNTAEMVKLLRRMEVAGAAVVLDESIDIKFNFDAEVQKTTDVYNDLAKHIRPELTKSTQEEMLALVGEFDARKWAEMFVRTDPPTDRDTMQGWFANAIMAGYDHAKKQEREAQAKEVTGEREVWAEAYRGGICLNLRPVQCAAIADEAVALFRERYK